MKTRAEASQRVTNAESELFFGEFLVSKGLINHRELTEALNDQRAHGARLGEVLVRLKDSHEKLPGG